MALKARQARDSSFILQDTHLPPPPDGSKKSWRSGIAPWGLILTFSWGPHSHSLSGGLELKPKDERGDRRENNSWIRDPGSFALSSKSLTRGPRGPADCLGPCSVVAAAPTQEPLLRELLVLPVFPCGHARNTGYAALQTAAV